MSFSQYKNYYVLHWFPYWRDNPKDWMSFEQERHINPIGWTYQESYQDYTEYMATNTYMAKGRQAIWELNDLFDTLLGRYEKLWLPSWKKDVELISDIGASDINLQVTNIDLWSTFYPDTPGTGRYLFIYVNQNTWFCRQLTAFPETGVITIDSALGQAIAQSRCKMVSFLYLGRLDVDEIEWQYATPTIAKTTLDFVELPKAYADL